MLVLLCFHRIAQHGQPCTTTTDNHARVTPATTSGYGTVRCSTSASSRCCSDAIPAPSLSQSYSRYICTRCATLGETCTVPKADTLHSPSPRCYSRHFRRW